LNFDLSVWSNRLKKILIMGLPGAGKTTLAEKLLKSLPDAVWFNADEQRKIFNDWDFSSEGRIRQAHRMSELAELSGKTYVIADFIAALEEQRDIFKADVVIWMNTIQSCKFEDTNKAFQPPVTYDIRFDSFDSVNVEIVQALISKLER
jgi:adenylylsulfate kinase